MGYFLSVSLEASNNVKDIVEYLRREWTEKPVLKFEVNLIKGFTNILAHPKSWLLIDEERQIRKYKISRHNSAYYRLKGEEIEIITVFDHRRNPQKLKELFEKL